jgi:hypothetical protein
VGRGAGEDPRLVFPDQFLRPFGLPSRQNAVRPHSAFSIATRFSKSEDAQRGGAPIPPARLRFVRSAPARPTTEAPPRYRAAQQVACYVTNYSYESFLGTKKCQIPGIASTVVPVSSTIIKRALLYTNQSQLALMFSNTVIGTRTARVGNVRYSRTSLNC